MKELLDRLKEDLQDEERRYAYADSVVNALVSAQIKALREDRNLNQERLAELIGTRQSGVSRFERADYSAWKIDTLRKLARAFGVRLRVSFEDFGSLVNEVSGFTKERLAPRKFEDDPAFREQPAEEEKIAAASSAQIGALKKLATGQIGELRSISLPKILGQDPPLEEWEWARRILDPTFDATKAGDENEIQLSMPLGVAASVAKVLSIDRGRKKIPDLNKRSRALRRRIG